MKTKHLVSGTWKYETKPSGVTVSLLEEPSQAYITEQEESAAAEENSRSAEIQAKEDARQVAKEAILNPIRDATSIEEIRTAIEAAINKIL